jgi:hypothetical protein
MRAPMAIFAYAQRVLGLGLLDVDRYARPRRATSHPEPHVILRFRCLD